MHTRTKLFSAAALIAALAAGGSAFTASNTMPVDPQNVGYGTVSVSGGTVDHIDYTINATDVSKLDGVVVWFSGDYTKATVTVQWNNGGSPAYTPVTCTTGAFDTTDTKFTCLAAIDAVDATDLDVTLTTADKP